MMKFSRQSRLLKPAEFKLVFQQPFRSGDELFRILGRANGLRRHRLGLAVSKKSCASAVGRNRIKRVIRENFRTRMPGIGGDNTLDFVVLPKPEAANQSNTVLNESLLIHWQRLIGKAELKQSGNRYNKQRTQK